MQWPKFTLRTRTNLAQRWWRRYREALQRRADRDEEARARLASTPEQMQHNREITLTCVEYFTSLLLTRASAVCRRSAGRIVITPQHIETACQQKQALNPLGAPIMEAYHITEARRMVAAAETAALKQETQLHQ
jgi:hypothetical protein